MEKKQYSKNLWKFIILSIIGIVLFIFPVPINGELNIMVAVIAAAFSNWTLPVMPVVVYGFIIISGVGTLFTRIVKPKFVLENKTLCPLFDVSNLWTFVRVSGMIIAIMCIFGKGPEALISAETGGTYIVNSLLLSWIGTILVAGSLMDLLLNYGLMEFVGMFMSRLMRPLYRVPGRCAVDCIASWLGDAIVGILITTNQYQTGYYSRREAAVIATTFSAVSISFTLLVVSQLNLSHMFFSFFLVTLATGLICGIIMTRIPPLRTMPDTYYVEGAALPDEKDNTRLFKRAVESAVARSASEPFSFVGFVKKGVMTTIECAITCMPTVMLIGTLSLALSYYTPIFTWLGIPFEPLLDLLRVPEAQAASECILAGFGDMFIPSILASANIQSEFTRCFIGILSITQLIYMSEVGALLLSSKLPLKFMDLVVIFLERTLICIPVIVVLLKVFVF